MVVMQWRGVLRLFHGNPQHPQQTHGQRFGAIDAAFLWGKWLFRSKLKRSTLSEGWDAPLGAQTIPLGSQQWQHCASQVIDLI